MPVVRNIDYETYLSTAIPCRYPISKDRNYVCNQCWAVIQRGQSAKCVRIVTRFNPTLFRSGIRSLIQAYADFKPGPCGEPVTDHVDDNLNLCLDCFRQIHNVHSFIKIDTKNRSPVFNHMLMQFYLEQYLKDLFYFKQAPHLFAHSIYQAARVTLKARRKCRAKWANFKIPRNCYAMYPYRDPPTPIRVAGEDLIHLDLARKEYLSWMTSTNL